MNRTPRPLFSLLTMLSFLLLGSPMAFGERTAPNGTVTPRRGPYTGKECKYGDGSAKFTRLSEFTVAELEEFLSGKKEPPLWAQSEFRAFVRSMKERAYYFYGSQLAKEGYDRYKELVRACLENGDVATDLGHCRHKAPLPIGINIYTGKATADYEMLRDHRDYWIIEPGRVQ